ncbi:diacylglycerol kinase [Clostridium acetobutylicum]|nr:diacylglycerol kinase [Clostridium acetobutylicum]
MKPKKLVDSFNHALEGIIYAVRTQQNVRIDLIAALVILTMCFFYKFDKSRTFNYNNNNNNGNKC